MTTTYIINGSKFEVSEDDTTDDLSPDQMNSVGMFSDEDESDILQPTELGDSLKQLNMTIVDKKTKMSEIDLRTILHPFQVQSIASFDALVAMGMLPQDCMPISTQIKRLAVSINGTGRKQIVETVVGKRDNDIQKSGGSGFMGHMKSFVGLGNG